MEYRKLGAGGLDVSVVSFGCWQMAGGFGETQEADFIGAVDAAIDAGINLFDTAEVYGRGLSEEVLGRALAGKRNKVLIATKIFTGDYNAELVEERLDASLKRLQTDHVDLYQYHWPRQNFDRAAAETAMASMLRMMDKGKIRAIGVSNFFAAQMADCLAVSDKLSSDQPPYSILWREVEAEVLPFCREHNIAVLAYSPLAQGLLSGKYDLENRPAGKMRQSAVFFREGIYDKALEVVDVMRPIAEAHGKTMAQVAVNWLICQPGVTSAICGTKRADQAIDSAGASGWSLTDDEVKTIGDAGLQFWGQVSGYPAIWERRPDPAG